MGNSGTTGTEAVVDAEEHFAGHDLALRVFEQVRAALADVAGTEVRVSRSQVTFTRRRAFAWLWLPGRYLRNPTADVVLSVALGRHCPSSRFKEVAHPTPRHWVHHLEVRSTDDIDPEVVGWLHEAAARAG